MWSSVGGKSYTLVVFVTLFYAVWSNGQPKLVKETRTTETVPCQTNAVCPPVSAEITTIESAPGTVLTLVNASISRRLTLHVSAFKRRRELRAEPRA
jgi:hypothetical protein